ncbi:aminoacyl-tRNA hydrolase [Patescibacteria group bacterium]
MKVISTNMKFLIVGLGNPGTQYDRTKHNTGFIIVDEMVKLQEGMEWKEENKFKAQIAQGNEIIFLKPLTFMNLSGESVSKVASFFKIDPGNIVVIHDDVDFPLLEWKLQLSKDSAGHNGVEDIMQKLGTNDFWRVRVGVGRPEDKKFDVEDYVLSLFKDEDLDKVENLSGEIWIEIEKKFFN